MSAEIETKIAELQGQIDGLKTNYDGLANTINSLISRINSIETNGLKTTVGNINQKIHIHEQKLIKIQREKRANGGF